MQVVSARVVVGFLASLFILLFQEQPVLAHQGKEEVQRTHHRQSVRNRRAAQRLATVPRVAFPRRYYQIEEDTLLHLTAFAYDPNKEDRRIGFTYQWAFGDGSGVITAHNLRTAHHRFKEAGTYTVKVRVKDRSGAISKTASTKVRVAKRRIKPSPTTTPAATTTASPSPTATATMAPTATATPTSSATSTPTTIATPSATQTIAPTPTATATPVQTPTVTATPTKTPTPTPTETPVTITTVHPSELTDTLLSNPDIGWQSCDRVNTSGMDAQGLPNHVAYIKYYWKNLENKDGVFDFSVFDANLAKARSSGQKVAFRIVVVDNITSGPTWLKNLGVSGGSFVYNDGGGAFPAQWSPSLEDPVVQQRHFAFLQEMGRRYDGSPDIDSIDIGTVGLWGEWHFADVQPAVAMPSVATRQLIIDKYFQYFPKTPKVAQLQDLEGLKYAIAKGSGFRGDCWGNMNFQMPRLYPNNISGASAADAWKHAPIMMESCWDVSYWIAQGWDVDYILNWALAHHVSAVNNKNRAVPTAVLPKVESFLKKLGYRLVLRALRHPASVKAGTSLLLSTDWENTGVAPPYNQYVLGVQLRNSSGAAVYTVATTSGIKGWLPGPLTVDQTVRIPSTLAPGTYTVAIAIVDPSSMLPKVQLASTGRESSGWYPLSSLKVE